MNETVKTKMQRQVRLSLKEVRQSRYLSAEQAADLLGIELATYRTLEGRCPKNRAISSLVYLEKIASHCNVSLSEYVSFLEGNSRGDARKPHKWEISLLSKFNKIGIPLRKRLLKSLDEESDSDLRDTIAFIARIFCLPQDKRQAVYHIAEILEKHE